MNEHPYVQSPDIHMELITDRTFQFRCLECPDQPIFEDVVLAAEHWKFKHQLDAFMKIKRMEADYEARQKPGYVEPEEEHFPYS